MSLIRIRDPVHGAIAVAESERNVLSHPLVARLRGVRQLGFVEHVFPGATHSRYAHGLGAMHVATELFDAILPDGTLSVRERTRLRAALRMAALLHDLGHPPFSHSLEAQLPSTGEPPGHETFTRHIFRSSTLRDAIVDAGVDPADVETIWGADGAIVAAGVDYTALLRSLVSGELDCDRMDYLLRDAHHTGVSYGRFDYEWIRCNVASHVVAGMAHLALSRRALYAFEDFLLSRLQMFLAVYFHPTSVAFDEMLRLHFASGHATFVVPADPDAFASCDDAALLTNLRSSSEPWARRVVERRPFRTLFETDEQFDLVDDIQAELAESDIEHFRTDSRGVVSKYFGGESPLFVVESHRVVPVATATSLYERHRRPVHIARLYVAREAWSQAIDVRTRVAKGASGTHNLD